MGLVRGRGRGRGGISKMKNRGPGGKPPPLMGRIAPPPGMVMRGRGPPVIPPLVPPRMRPHPPGLPLIPPMAGMRPPPMPPVLGGPRPPLPPFHPPPHVRPLPPPPMPLRPPVPPPSLLRGRGQGLPPPVPPMRGPGFRPPGPPMLGKFGPPKRNMGPQKNLKKKPKGGKKIESGDEETDKPWVTEAMKNEIQKKHKLYLKAKKSNQQSDWDEFKEQRNRVTTMLREAKLEYIGSHPEEVGDFYCETCDRQFSLLSDMNSHVEGHQSCGLEGCTFTADPKVLTKHIEVQHLSGIFSRIGSLDSPEDIQNWIAERKRRYPTRENIERRRAEQEEKLKRGEKLAKDPSLFNKDFRRNRQVQSKAKKIPEENSKMQRNKPAKFQACEIEDDDDGSDDYDDDDDEDGYYGYGDCYCDEEESEDEEYEMCRAGVPRFLGTRGYKEDEVNAVSEDGKYSDTEWDCSSCPTSTSVPSVSKALSSLMNSYGSELSGSDDEPPQEMPICKTAKNGVNGSHDMPDESTKLFSSQGPGKCDIGRTTEETVSNEIEGSFSACASLDEPSPSNLHVEKSTALQDHNVIVGREGTKTADHQAKARKLQRQPKQRPKTLLEKLLEREIRHERNVILQCVRHIVSKSFFESESSVEGADCSKPKCESVSSHPSLGVVLQCVRYAVNKNFFDVEPSQET